MVENKDTSITNNLNFGALLVLGMASPALASHCPMDMKKIEAAMKTAILDDAKNKKVMELYENGKAEHESGNHKASEADLAEAMKFLEI